MKLDQPHIKKIARQIGIAIAIVATAGTGWAVPPAPMPPPPPPSGGKSKTPAIDPQALALLHKMSDFLGSQQQLAVHAEGSIEVVRDSGQKLEFSHASQIWVKRPNKLRSDRRGEKASVEFFYDGKTFTLFGSDRHYYATAPAPPTLDQAIDVARERLGLETGAADLLYTKPYDELTEDITGALYLGPVDLHGVTCHHLAFQGTQTNWEIWIADGKEPAPCRLLITSKDVKAAPEFRTDLTQWDFKPDLDDNLFHFTPPPDAKRIDFMGPPDARVGKTDKNTNGANTAKSKTGDTK